MKSILTLTAGLTAPLLVTAQTEVANNNSGLDINEMFKVVATIGILLIVMIFTMIITKRIQDFKLKTMIIEKGIPDNIALSVLRPDNPKEGNSNVKWFAILAGIGLGLTIINYNQPIGLHSLATMVFCLAGSFLGYYIFEKKSSK